MGRAKLEIKYRENSRARVSTYMNRMKGLKKKAGELSVLCGVDVLVASFSPELNTVQFWPEQDTLEFHRIRERYLDFRRSEKRSDCSDERNYGSNENNACRCLPTPSPSFPSNREEERVAMEIKLKEVRESLCFLQANELQPQQMMLSSQPQEEQLLHLVQFTDPPSSPSLDLSSSFGSQILPDQADFTADDWNWGLFSSFDSPILPAHADFTTDDWGWCDSLVDLNDF